MAKTLKNNLELVWIGICFTVIAAFALGPLLVAEVKSQAPGARYYANPAAADQGDTTAARSVSALAAAIGTSKKATIVLPKVGSGVTEEYLFSTAWDGSAYTNIVFEIEQGAEIRVDDGVSGVTLPKPGNIKAQPNQQIVSGTSLFFAGPGTVYPEWFEIDGTADNVQADRAYASLTKGGNVVFTGDAYSFATYATVKGNTTTTIGPQTIITLAQSANSSVFFISGISDVLFNGGGVIDGNRVENQSGNHYLCELLLWWKQHQCEG